MAVIFQHPGQTVVFEFSFNASQEQSVVIYEAGKPIATRNSDSDKSNFEPGKNNGNEIKQFSISGLFKYKRSGEVPWHKSEEKQLLNDKNKIIIGYNDRTNGETDSDFDDAVVRVSFS